VVRFGPYRWAACFENRYDGQKRAEPSFKDDHGVLFRGVEQYYQVHKHRGALSRDNEFLIEQETVRKMEPTEASAWGALVDMREDWPLVKMDIMAQALKCNFNQNIGLGNVLRATYPFPLVYVTKDAFWGTGLDGTGCNHLGTLLVNLREDLF
jgi:ribA/ribD-fused uncharacterized protein